MSQAASNPAAAAAAAAGMTAHHDGAGHHHHDPHLAHHFDTPEQQYQSAKLGMWIFLATEILMFGGLFVAYSVYRHNNPDVFAFAHKALDPILGGVNTVVLITSSLTMAWGVRLAQLGKHRGLAVCLILTLLGGAGFMAIKTVEYKAKWEHHLFPGKMNVYSRGYEGTEKPPVDLGHASAEGQHDLHGASDQAAHPETQKQADASHGGGGGTAAGQAKAVPNASSSNAAAREFIVDPNAGTGDEVKIKPNLNQIPGLAPEQSAAGAAQPHVTYTDLSRHDRERVATFFSVYFLMTGLHGVHVLVGMGLISWVLFRALRHEFGPAFFTPVDLVGLYWHLVDLIWIFLFPLLYLIH